MVRTGENLYQVRDGSNQLLHRACGLYEAILHAGEHQGRSVLGYSTRDAAQLKQWIIAKTTAPSERRTVLAEPPIRPVVQFDTQLLVRGGGLSRDGESLHERIEDLYPHFTAREVDAFAQALTEQGEPLKAIEAMENDLEELRETINRWRYQQPDTWGPGSHQFRDGGGLHIHNRLLDCLERKTENLGNAPIHPPTRWTCRARCLRWIWKPGGPNVRR
ncbi:hypothetical protein V5O39_30885 [Pseudomonas parakoreensis]